MENSFVKKEYWKSLEEYYQSSVYTESLSKEFDLPPQEQEVTGVERRDFLKIMGASFLLAGAACTRRPVEKIIPYVNKPLESTPGIPTHYASTCNECSAGCGLVVTDRESRPVKLEGNKLHPLNQGGLCARGQASILNLYDPDRLKGPLFMKRGQGLFQEGLTWAKIDEEISKQLKDVQSKGKKIVLMTGVINSPTTKSIISKFLAAFPGSQHVVFEGVVPEEVLLASEATYGAKSAPRFHFEKAKYILSFGADFLGTYISPVEYAKGFAKARSVKDGAMARFVAVESSITLTGMNADEHFAVKSGDELSVVLGLANEIILAKGVSGLGSGQVRSVLTDYSLDTVASKTGIDLAKLKAVADDLIKNKGQGLVVGGSVRGANGVALQIAVNLLNSALSNEGVTVESGSNQIDGSSADLLALLDSIKSNKVGALFIYRSNPAYTLPASLGFADSLKNVDLVVSFSSMEDETAKLADYVLPDAHYLEGWNDHEPVKGVLSLTQPTIAPLYDTRQFQQSILKWASISDSSWYDYLKKSWEEGSSTVFGANLPAGSWEDTLRSGVLVVSNAGGGTRSFNAASFEKVAQAKKPTSPYTLSVYPSISMYDGRSANIAWLQELPDPLAKIAWDNFLSVSPKFADSFKLVEGEVIRIDGDGIKLEAPVHIQPMMSDTNLMISLGYGRASAGRVGTKVGISAQDQQQILDKQLVWGGLSVNTITKTGIIERMAITQGHHNLEGRDHDILHEFPLATFLADKGEAEKGEEPSLWSGHEYNGYKWGMVIDMNVCTGCSACTIACQSENNIPTVGKAQVLRGREMHWIRIDRYYKGELENPTVAFQPMLCQHCENAPCETVCPVLATVHGEDGLNEMIYNRCVGTRYCANNCPYKVRRFNFFDYTESIAKPLNLQLNPDITVRSQGVMEKCSFCMHRIRYAKDMAKDEGRKVRDGEVVVACQQGCPTDAIVFGDLNDPESRVAKMVEDRRKYRVLEELNVRPRVNYLAKIRNA